MKNRSYTRNLAAVTTFTIGVILMAGNTAYAHYGYHIDPQYEDPNSPGVHYDSEGGMIDNGADGLPPRTAPAGTWALQQNSAVWSARMPNFCLAYTCKATWLLNVSGSVSYHVSATNHRTGAPILPGATVPKDTQVTFAFTPHNDMDISWFGTGNANDSPYGHWTTDAQRPANLCTPDRKVQELGTTSYFASFAVAPPTKTITGLPAGCAYNAADASATCTLSVGTVTPVFRFNKTHGHFYMSSQPTSVTSSACPVNAYFTTLYWGSVWNGTPYYADVQAVNLPFPLTVVEVSGSAPVTPTLSGGGSCVVGSPHTITMQSTDPDNDTIRYGVDWDANGTIDQFVPGTGYVNSGTPQTASRTYATAGSKMVKVMAEDSTGLTSAFGTISFACEESVSGAENTNTNTNTSGSGTGSFTSGTGFTGSGGSGVEDSDLTLRVTPSLVRMGATTHVHWSATNITLGSCRVTGSNGDAWSGPTSSIGGETSGPILSRTVYTLSCRDLNGVAKSKSASVRILPVFYEL